MCVNWRIALLASAILVCISCKKNKSSGLLTPGDGSDTLVVSPPKPALYTQKAVKVDITSNTGGFYEALPPNYDSASDERYPLLVFLHGGGELGNGHTDLPRIKRNGITKLLDRKTFPKSFVVDGKEYSFIIISPQFKAWPGVNDVAKIIDYASANYNVDTQRIYLVGMSMGGGATWEFAADHGKELAAIVPVCGATSPKVARVKKLATTNVPTWAFHNRDDNVVSVNYTIKYFDLLKADNPEFPVKMTLWETGGHDSWSRSMNPDTKEDGKNIYEWMLQYKR